MLGPPFIIHQQASYHAFDKISSTKKGDLPFQPQSTTRQVTPSLARASTKQHESITGFLMATPLKAYGYSFRSTFMVWMTTAA